MQEFELRIDVTEAAGLGEAAHIAVTVTLPDPAHMPKVPFVCFAKPGGGYSRGYYTHDLPGPAKGAQASWHAQRGWIFISVDHLGVGASSLHPGKSLDFVVLARAAHAAEAQILAQLAEGTLAEGFPAIRDMVKLGIGQSMGGCMTVVQQGRFHDYDGVGVLGYSVIHTSPLHREDPTISPWFGRDTLLSEPLIILNPDAFAKGAAAGGPGQGDRMMRNFHYDDVSDEIAIADLAHFNRRELFDVDAHAGFVPAPWHSFSFPVPVAPATLTPGIIAGEAAAIRVPVLSAFGERDVSREPKDEPKAYFSSPSIDVFVCPRMGHMHNFASTRELFWERIDTWAEWVRAARAANLAPRYR
ncbi:MAG TPA: hypothetical protein VFP14_04850 [Novosphingobium sp.]|nr:hypothetical protein [Novosphingobium sp.]